MNPLIPLFEREQQDAEFEADVEIEKLAATMGWQKVLHEAFEVLGRLEHKSHWHRAAVVIFGAVGRQIPLPIPWEECAARLYYCLERYPDLGVSGLSDGGNLVWSIVHDLKGVSYTSSWDPYHDLKILELLAKLRSAG